MISSIIILLLLCCSLIDGSSWAIVASDSFAAFIITPTKAKIATTSSSSVVFAALENGDAATQTNSQPSFTLKQRNPYDVHVYYSGSNQREKAMLLRSKMKQQFPWMRFYEPKDVPIGPHPLPMWEADFASYDNRVFWGEVCDFIKEEHEDLSVLVHPHSFNGDYADHTKNAFWVGDVLELRIQGWKR
mmetsp:Transcript_34479/g.51681  ORF Transcript_34479/g.51681 Transcript_34479/m.51681 type:complete len:188 (-) Transcript_34479:452-1015(-)